MAEFLSTLTYWHWLGLGLALLTAEMLLPGIYLIWLGLAALVTSLIVALVPSMEWPFQLGTMAFFSLVSVVSGHFWIGRHPVESDQPLLNRRADQYKNRIFTLTAAIENGFGKVKVDDSIWRVQGPDAPVNSKVKVIGVDGTVLIVEPLESA